MSKTVAIHKTEYNEAIICMMAQYTKSSLSGMREKGLNVEQVDTIEALAARACEKHQITRETINSILEAEFGFGGIECLRSSDYSEMVRFLAVM